MDLASRRSSYSLLSQFPDDPPPPPPKFDSPPPSQTLARSPLVFAPIQRQSSGSSFAESSLSGGDYLLPPTISSAAPTVDIDLSAAVAGIDRRGAPASTGSTKSWAQQAEETYQMQLALALRLCSDAACANDPNFMEAGDQPGGGAVAVGAAAEAISHRFWVQILDSFFFFNFL